MQLLSDIFSGIHQSLADIKTDRATLVGINGVDVAGKTTFALQLDQYLAERGQSVQLIHLDDFLKPKEERRKGKNAIEAYIRNAFNLEFLIAELLEPVRQGQVIQKELTLLNLEADSYTGRKRYHIGRDTIVILEGVLLYRKPLDRHFDYRIYLDISLDEMLHRARRRDVPRFGPEILELYRQKYIPIQHWYLENHSPVQKCNLVIDNNDVSHPTVSSI